MSAAPSKLPQVPLTGILVEIDVTPRWYLIGPSFYEDLADIARALGTYEGTTHRLLVDLSTGLTGVRVVLQVPSGNITDALAAEQIALRTHLDALDGVSPRRRRVTLQREEAARKAAEDAAAKERVTAPVGDPVASEDGARPVAAPRPQPAEPEAASPPA